MSEKISRGVWVQLIGMGLVIVSVILLALGWWIAAIFTGLAAIGAFFNVRKAVIDERIDEVLAPEKKWEDDDDTKPGPPSSEAV